MGTAEPQNPLLCPGTDAGMFAKEVVDTPVSQGGVPRHVGGSGKIARFGDDVDDESYEKLASRILDDMDSKEGRLNTLLESNKKLFDIFNEDPEVLDWLS